jgi:hypothetical protein
MVGNFALAEYEPDVLFKEGGTFGFSWFQPDRDEEPSVVQREFRFPNEQHDLGTYGLYDRCPMATKSGHAYRQVEVETQR